jgi:Rieske Fe-S protein
MYDDNAPAEAGPAPLAASRRAVLAGAGAAAVVVLSGCATYDQTGGAPPPEEPAPVEPEGGADPSQDAGGGDAGGGGPAPIAKTGDVPVGGGVILERQRVVVTQPAKGEFKAFTAVCTHQGCLVTSVEGGTINCACHGSKFKVADGSVAGGPAGRPLREVDIAVDGEGITLA